MNILVTGGAGFIGSHLCEALLRQNHRVVAVDNFDPFYDPAIKESNMADCMKSKAFVLHRGDILDAGLLDLLFVREKFDVVVHLAAKAGVRPSLQDPLGYAKVNVEGTLNILESMRKHNVGKLILASSSSVYGNNTKVPYSETDNVDHTISPYAATKKACEILAYTYYHLYGIETFCLRFFTVYGPRQRPEMAIHAFTKAIFQGQPVNVFGDGHTCRDYTYVDDIVQGILQCMAHLRGFEVLNLGESRTVALIDLVKWIEKHTGKKAAITYLPEQPGDVKQTYANIAKARDLVGYDPQIQIPEGIGRFVEWFRSAGGLR